MKLRFLTILAAIMVALGATAATDEATALLDQAAAKFKEAPSISAAYALTSGSNKVSGRLTFSADRFCMTSPQILTWFDGKTQWSYNKADNEVTVSEPTAAELTQINPFAVINSFRNSFTAKLLPAPKGFKKLELKAKEPKSDILSATVTLNETTLMPTQINLVPRSGQPITILLTSVTTGQRYNIKAFQFYAPNYPGVQTVDLR